MVKGSIGIGVCVMLLCMLVSIGCEVTDVPEGMSAEVSFEVEKGNYEIGSSVKTILKNESELQISYNPCSSKLVHKNEDTWQQIDPSLFCTYDLKDLNPGDSVSYHIDLTDKMKLQEGAYKVEANIEAEEEKTIATQPFEVVSN
jgi:hypothetical protein